MVLSASQCLSKGWERQAAPETVRNDLHAVSFANSLHGMACGERGAVIVTEDGGNTWDDVTDNLLKAAHEYIPFPVTLELYSIKLTDHQNCWCAGKAVAATMDMEGRSFPVIFHTSDMGQSWTLQYPAFDILPDNTDFLLTGSYNQINDLFFLDSLQGWAVGWGSKYLVTEDGGFSWEPDYLDLITIPEVRIVMNASAWLDPDSGMVAGFTDDMNCPELSHGFVASRTASSVDGSWRMEKLPAGASTPVLNDIAINRETDKTFHAVTVGDSGTILRRNSEGKWHSYTFPWPLAFTLPDFRALSFSDTERGWAAGYFRKGITVDPEDSPPYMTIFKTLDAGNEWQSEPVDIIGMLNDISAVDTKMDSCAEEPRIATDAWAVGTRGTILHYHNSPPLICSLNPRPSMVYAGESFIMQARVDDWDNPFEDIAEVTVDASSIGAGIINMEFAGAMDRRCILYEAEIQVPALASYGSHPLPVTVKDRDNATDTSETSIFVVTSWVDILDAWAEPQIVPAGKEVHLFSHVVLIAPKDNDITDIKNRIESVEVNVSDLLGIDCGGDADCEAWVPMEYDPESGFYTAVSQANIPGCHSLPVVAKDTLGHTDSHWISVCVAKTVFDYDRDHDVDGLDLLQFIKSGDFERPGNIKPFASQFGNCMPVPESL